MTSESKAGSENAEVCREHHFYEGIGRCWVCQIRPTYYAECMDMLNKWSDKDKQTEEWKRGVDNLKCDPHNHKPTKESA